MKTQNAGLNVKAVLQGSLLILITNLIYVGNNYLVAWTELTAPEVALMRGSLQSVIFGVLVWRTKENEIDISETKQSRVVLYALLVLYGFTLSTSSFACLAAIPYMPIGDLIVICFTSPVFSVFLDRIILKKNITILSMLLCFFIVVGDVLVIQPPFLFKEENVGENETDDAQRAKKHNPNYYLGVALCLYTAGAVSVANVLNAKCSKMKVSTPKLMLVSGISSVILSIISVLFLPNRVLTNPASLPTKSAALLPVSGSLTMVAYWTKTWAISIAGNATLIAMLRSTEILISLVTESIWWNEVPDTLSLLGALLVSLCVLGMAGHDKTVLGIKHLWGKYRGTTKQELK